ncbi:nucleotidyltransferase family protein [Gemmatimonadota bacterium]
MGFDPLHPQYWPSASQEDLLDAALLEGDAAGAAWDRWISEVDLDTADTGSVFILPAVYKNLIQAGYPDGELAKIKGVYRFSWGRNQLTCNRVAKIVSLLEHAGVECLVLKGTALLMTTYEDVGLRMMSDFDLLIREGQLDQAASVLGSNGWSCSRPPKRFEFALREIEFNRPDHPPLDLHFNDFPAGCKPASVGGLWNRTERVEWMAMGLSVPDATDLLLHCCIEGRKLDPQGGCRWIIDLHEIIRRRGADLDWEALPQRVSEMGLVLPVRDAMNYVKRRFEIPIPESVMHELSRGEDLQEDVERYRTHLRRRTATWEGRFLRHRELYAAGIERAGGRFRVWGFVAFLVGFYGWRIPFVLKKTIQRWWVRKMAGQATGSRGNPNPGP